MPRRSSAPNKCRTPEHIIADLAINHVERQVLLSGNTAERKLHDYGTDLLRATCGNIRLEYDERKLHDYGTDLLLSTYSQNGEVEPGVLAMQVKSTDHLTQVLNQKYVTCRVERAHLRVWLSDPFPVFLIYYDAQQDRAYWLHVQSEFEGSRRF